MMGFSGAAHSNCNLKYVLPKIVPIFFHNFSNYDCHLFIKELVHCNIGGQVSVIPSNMETYTCVDKVVPINRARDNRSINLKLSFRDSFRFLTTSLDNLSKNLVNDDFISLKSFIHRRYPDSTQEENNRKIQLLQRKGIFPYEVAKSFDDFDRIIELPPEDQFRSCLNDYQALPQDDYEHARTVWEEFGCTNLGDYSDLYLHTDVLLLSDVFEKFRNDSLDKSLYGLDPANFLTLPGFAWSSMLKIIDEEIELITDPDMWNFVMRGIRGGFSGCIERAVTANNKYINDGPIDDPTYIIYMDVNNLYGYASSMKLPKGEFQWIGEDKVSHYKLTSIIFLILFISFQISKLQAAINTIDVEGDYGVIVEVDVEYPEELHDAHDDFPFLIEKMRLGKVDKLCGTLNVKQNYVCHLKTLQQAMTHGLVLRKLHRGLMFRQSEWMKPYIDINTKRRAESSSKSVQELCKLMVIIVFWV